MPRKFNANRKHDNVAEKNTSEAIVALAFSKLKKFWSCANPFLEKVIVNFPENMNAEEQKFGTYDQKTPLKAVVYEKETKKLFIDLENEGNIYYVEAELCEKVAEINASYVLPKFILEIELKTEKAYLDLSVISPILLYVGENDTTPQIVKSEAWIKPSLKDVLPNALNISTTTVFTQECIDEGKISFKITDSRQKQIGTIKLLEKAGVNFEDALSELEATILSDKGLLKSFVHEKCRYYCPYTWEQMYVAMTTRIMNVEF